MDPRCREVKKAPDSVDWPGRGTAYQQPPRGMDDYEKPNYITDDGAILRFRAGVRWQAQYKSETTKWFPTAERAIQNLEDRINDTRRDS